MHLLKVRPIQILVYLHEICRIAYIDDPREPVCRPNGGGVALIVFKWDPFSGYFLTYEKEVDFLSSKSLFSLWIIFRYQY